MRSALEAVEGARAVEVAASDHDGALDATVESDLGVDLRGRIAAKVVGGGFELLELRTVSLSLEEIFMQLTTEEKPTEENAAL